MGDRGNIKVLDEPSGSGAVYLYTHWGGSDIKTYLANALDRGRDRWDDPAYLARIIFCEMLKSSSGDPLDETTGLGISTQLCDNEHPILVVHCDSQAIETEEGKSENWQFEEFIQKFKSK